jgi:hypothetical protein
MSGLLMFLGDASGAIGKSAQQACGTGAASVCGNANISNIFNFVANALIFVIGAVAVIMIILGGLRYVTSNGDAKATASAKDTILYAVVGLVVAIAAYAIVNFVVTHFK